MRISAKSNNIVSFVAGIFIAGAFFAVPFSPVKGGKDVEVPVTGVTNASEAIRESRFELLDLNGDGYLTRDELPQSEGVLASMYSSLDEDGDGRLSEAEYVLNGKAS